MSVLIADLNHADDAEVIVIDDGSDPAVRTENIDLCDRLCIRYVAHEKRRGVAAARNTGMKKSIGTWVAFLDDDVTVCRNWYEKLHALLTGVSEYIVGVEGRVEAEGNGLWDREVSNEDGGLFLTCHCMYRADALKKENGFDEHFTGRYPACEDHELASRMQRWGNVIFDKRISVVHSPRQRNLAAYCAGSFERMQSQLDAEYYFYVKQRDRYHCFRHNATFFGTLRAILFKHTLTTLHRRSIKAIVQHPVQFATLAISSLLEQACAWILTPVFIWRFFRSPLTFFSAYVDSEMTEKFWGFQEPLSLQKFAVQASMGKSLLFPLLRQQVFSPLPVIRRCIRWSRTMNNNRCFLRIDDVFLDQKDAVLELCEIAAKRKIPFLAGVIGSQIADRQYDGLMDRIVSCGGEIGLHGFFHEGKFGPYNSEILQKSLPTLGVMVKKVLTEIPQSNRPLAFMPPFNAICREQIVFLGNYFRVICGGPETARFTDKIFGPVALKNGSWYFPAFYPFYQRATSIVRSGALHDYGRAGANICFAVHLADEAQDGFRGFSDLLDVIGDKLTKWSCFERGGFSGGGNEFHPERAP